MANSQSLSVFGCIGLVSLLVLASEVSAQNHNITANSPWVWVDLPHSIVTGDLALQPGQNSKSWNHDGWVCYGKKATADECKQACGADNNCWAFSWHGSNNEWAGFCYGRAPNTRRVLPKIFKNSDSGHFSAYKSFAGQSFPKAFYYGADFELKWLPKTSFKKTAGVNIFADGFSSPTTKDKSIVKGYMFAGSGADYSSVGGNVIARTGAVNIGHTFTEDMCIAAADYMIYLDMVAGTPSVIANYYTWFFGIDRWSELCIIGSKSFGKSDNQWATSGKRAGDIPEIAVEPDYPD